MSLRVKKKIKIGEYLAKVTSKMHFARLANTLLKDEKKIWQNNGHDSVAHFLVHPAGGQLSDGEMPQGDCRLTVYTGKVSFRLQHFTHLSYQTD